MKAFVALFLPLLLLHCLPSFAQTELPIDEESGRVVFEGTRKVDLKSKKKMLEGMREWSSKKLEYPSMVFSVIEDEGKTLMLKVITELPSSRQLHPVSFRLILTPGKRKFEFRASEFYFEDINLTLEQWLEKYGKSENQRHKRNYALIVSGLNSHIFMSMNALAENFQNK